MFRVLLAKELNEQWRTSRFLVLAVVLTISGLISPILAKYTPALLRSLPDIPAGLAEMIPDPTIQDAIAQYVKNVSQFGLLLAVILTMSSVAQEKERGTAAMLLVRPVSRRAVIFAKWAAWLLTLVSGLVLSELAALLYTAILFERLPLGNFTLLNLLMALFIAVYIAISLLASTLARTQAMAAAGAFGGLAILLVLSSLPRVDQYMPSQLLVWGSALLAGDKETYWPALAISVGIIVTSLIVACWQFERQEI